MKTMSYKALENLLQVWDEKAEEYELLAERAHEECDTIKWVSALDTAHAYELCIEGLKTIKTAMEREGFDDDSY